MAIVALFKCHKLCNFQSDLRNTETQLKRRLLTSAFSAVMSSSLTSAFSAVMSSSLFRPSLAHVIYASRTCTPTRQRLYQLPQIFLRRANPLQSLAQPWSNAPPCDVLTILRPISMRRCVWLGFERNSAGVARFEEPWFIVLWPVSGKDTFKSNALQYCVTL